MLVCPWSSTSDDLLIAGRKRRERERERERARDCTVFALESFVLAWFLRISKHNVWVSQSILLQLLAMRTQNPNLSCAPAFVRQSRTFHSINVLCTFYRMHTFLNWRNILSWLPFGSDLDPNRVCKCRERERDWCRHVKVNLASADRQGEREREREVCVCVCVCSFWISSVFFFTLGTRLRISKFCVDLCKKNLIVRDV